MEPMIHFRSKRCKHLQLSIGNATHFRDIVGLFNDISLPESPIDDNLIRVSLLEVVSNSLRAHREHGILDPIFVEIIGFNRVVTIRVEDKGRGFIPPRLPYSLTDRIEDIDLMSVPFKRYREKHKNQRFGMGLYIARKTFHRFDLDFIDRVGQVVPWFSGRVAGTRIVVEIDYRKTVKGNDDGE
jgi:signal transduction histidine kinase